MKSLLVILTLTSSLIVNAQQWVKKADFTDSSRIFSKSFSIGDKGYVAFGRNGSTFYDDVWQFDPAANTWTLETTLPASKRSEGIVFTSDSLVYLGLGWNSTSTFKDLYRYSTSTQTWDTLLSYPGQGGRNCFYANANGKAYIGGGSMGTSVPYKSDFWEYDILNNTWTVLGSLPFGERVGGVSFAIDSMIYMGLGHDGNNDFKDLWAYNQTTGTWSQKADFPDSATIVPVFFVLNGKGIVGGGHRLGSNYGNTQENYYEYDPNSNTWSILTNNFSDSSRTAATAFAIGNKGYIFGGTSNFPTLLNDMHEYDSQIAVSIQEVETSNSSVDLFPVPNKGQFVIDLKNEFENQKVFLKVFNSQGKLVQEQRLQTTKSNIDLGNQPSGIYHFSIISESTSLNGSFSIVN